MGENAFENWKETRREQARNRFMAVSVREDGRQSAVTIAVLKVKAVRQSESCAGHLSMVELPGHSSWHTSL